MIRSSKVRIRLAELPHHAAAVACLASMPLYWPTLFHIGGSSIAPLHVGILLLVAASLADARALHSAVRMGIWCAPWLIAFAAYLLFFAVAAAGTPAISKIPRQILAVTGFLCMAGFYWNATIEPAANLRRVALLGLLIFLALTEYSARQIDKSFVLSFFDFLQSGNIKSLIYGFFRPVFNALEPDELSIKAAATNAVGAALFVLAVCHRIGFRKDTFDPIGVTVTLLVICLLVLMDARSGVVAAILGMFLAAAFRLIQKRGVSLATVLLFGAGLIVVAAIAFVVGVRGQSFADAIAGSYTFDDHSTEGRLAQYEWAFSLIDDRIFFGHGFLFTQSGNAIHNLFLSAWAYVGLHGFLLCLFFYINLIVIWVRWMYLALSRPGFWTLTARAEWVAVLPILPLFRVWLSGDGGFLTFSEWIALAVFLGLVARNESVRRRAEQARSGRRDAQPLDRRSSVAAGFRPQSSVT